jgi:hypothetical protein
MLPTAGGKNSGCRAIIIGGEDVTHDASQGLPQIGSMSNKNKRQFSKQVPEPVEQENGLATQRRGAELQLQKG